MKLCNKKMETIISTEKIKKTYTYEDYKNLVYTLTEKSSNTGEKTEERIVATKLNSQRLKRIDKQCELIIELKKEIKEYKTNSLWILLVESWCGDGAQCLPVISKIANESSNIELKIILRDENIEIMDSYLTNGSRSIPKLICINKNTNEEIGTWGPRPTNIQKMVFEFKQDFPNANHEEFVTNLHLLYARDKTVSIQTDFLNLFKFWNHKI